MNPQFKAMLVSGTGSGKYQHKIVKKEIQDLPEGDILINVKYSSLNYKDALSAKGNKGVTKKFPHTPGIDAAGVVVESDNLNFQVGDQVIVTGYDLGMNTPGGFAQYIRVPSQWVVKLPRKLSLRESMMFGTAGFTAALSVYKLIQSGVQPADGEILVTGATGGVGIMAVGILGRLNYQVIAATSKTEEKKMLQYIGAKDVIERERLAEPSKEVLSKGRWAGVIDTVGGTMLSNAIKATQHGGSVTCCGNVASDEISSSIYPFILRGVSLLGVDSAQCDMQTRIKIWDKLATVWKIDKLSYNIAEVSLDDLGIKLDDMLKGQHIGRTIVNLEL